MLPLFMFLGMVLGLITSSTILMAMPSLLQPGYIAAVLAGGAGLGAASFAILYWIFSVPRYIKSLVVAEMKRKDVLELVTHDGRSIFLPVRLEEGSIIVPEDRKWRGRLVLVTTPDAATPIEGSRTRLVRAIVDHPVVLDPDYIAVVVDFRRKYGFQHLAELLEADRYYDRKGQLVEMLNKLREELEKLDQGREEYSRLSPYERDQIRHDLQRQIRVYERLLEILPNDKPIATVRGRTWTADDVLGWLGYRMPTASLKSLMDKKETEGMLKGMRLGRELFTKALVAIAAIGIVVVIGMILVYMATHGGAPSVPGPVKLPQPTPANTTG